MAYNLEPLIQILEQMLVPDKDLHGLWILDSNDKAVIRSLLTKVCFFKDFFENTSSITGPEVRRLESRIRDTVYSAENVIGFCLADRQLLKKEGENLRVSPPTELLRRIDHHEFGCIFDNVVKIMDETQKRSCASSSQLVSPRQDLNPNKIVVGISEVLIQLRGRLTTGLHRFEVIPIVGMGGIGKTTLAKTLYDDPFVASNFDIRAWVAISQSYNVREIIIGLLKCDSRNSIDEMSAKNNDELTLSLHQFLFDRRYLIVLDDMWNPDAWVEISTSFPKTDGSRILVTTREHSVATYFGSHNLHHQMDFLNEAESWNLLSKRVFAEESCPPKLEEVGKNIAKDCKGLPLAIHVVGGILLRLGRTQESWVQVAKDVCTSMVDDNDGQCSNILSLSYLHLPNYLRPCFLYMSAFPEDYVIKSSKLIKLWVAEGLIKPILGRSLEEVAESYLRELVERSLLLVHQQESKWNVKSYIMHDLLRDLCIRRAQEEKFLHVMNDAVSEPDLIDCMQNWPRMSFHSNANNLNFVSKSTYFPCATRTVTVFLSEKYSIIYPPRLGNFVFFSLRLLSVLDIFAISLRMWPESVKELVNLRYLATFCRLLYLPSSICNLCNLQTLILGQKHFFEHELELFDLPRLRHLKFKNTYPICCVQDRDQSVALQDLQTLSNVVIDDSFPMILKATPNLKKLGIYMRGILSPTSSIDLACLSKLETLKCTCAFIEEFRVNFPPSLTKLTLSGCKLPSRHMERVGALPNLQILILRYCKFGNSIWEPTVGGFCQLQHLVFKDLNLVKLMADATRYPRLEHLLIEDCSLLKEIPREIGDISTLEIIELRGRSNAAALSESARRIQEEQEELWGNVLQVRINKLGKGGPLNPNLRGGLEISKTKFDLLSHIREKEEEEELKEDLLYLERMTRGRKRKLS